MSYERIPSLSYQPRIHQRSSLSYYIYKVKRTILSRFKQFTRLRRQNPQFRYYTTLIICSVLLVLLIPLMFLKYRFYQIEVLIDILTDGFMWLLLGILSTIGLGAGLHTFVLFLGPHIIKVVLTANECESVHFDTSINWFTWDDGVFNILTYPKESFQCLQPLKPVTFFSIFRLVLYPTICWGIGSALGEMPPYFIARTARMNGENIEELQELENNNKLTFMQRAKLFVINNVKHIGFIAIFLLAAIPNPLFDLAGLACGYLGIPFKTFLSATLTAKGFVKAPIQASFYVIFFSSSLLEYMINLIHKYIPVLEPYLLQVLNQISKQATNQCTDNSNIYDNDNKLDIHATIEKCIHCCNTSMKTSKIHNKCIERCNDLVNMKSSLLTIIWNAIITLAVLYFILSTIYVMYNSKKMQNKNSNENENAFQNDSTSIKLSV